MNKRVVVAVALALVVVIGVLGWLWMGRNVTVPVPGTQPADAAPGGQARTPSPPPVDPAPTPETPAVVPTPAVPPVVPQAAPLPPSERRDLANPLAPASVPEGPTPRPAEEDPAAAADLDRISLMIRDYRTIAGENPVGTNAEIMQAMMGKNPRGAKLGPPEGMSLNGQGELLDGWGTPIFFHQISRDVMEIHSAGPDKRLGTEDDLILK